MSQMKLSHHFIASLLIVGSTRQNVQGSDFNLSKVKTVIVL